MTLSHVSDPHSSVRVHYQLCDSMYRRHPAAFQFFLIQMNVRRILFITVVVVVVVVVNVRNVC